MRILLFRHGETQHNADRIALGRRDVPLNERGLAAAQSIARAYANGAHEIAAIYSSPLQRAVATVTPLADALSLPIEIDPDLIEMDIGEAEDKTYAELREQHPDFIRLWLSDQVADVPMPGGESLRQVQERAWRAIESIRERHGDETVVIVTHNFVILTIVCRVLGLPLANFRSVRQDVGAVSLLELTAERSMAIRLNDACHLEELGTRN
jgi:probable phosphoglycerate mutase